MNPITTTHTLALAAQAPRLDGLMLFGFLISFATFVCFLHQRRFGNALPALAACLAGMALYGFLQGAVALALLAAVCSGTTFASIKKRRTLFSKKAHPSSAMSIWAKENRMSQMFGPLRSRRRENGDWIGGES